MVGYAVVLGYAGDAAVFVGVALVLLVLLGLRRRQHAALLAWLVPAAVLGTAGELALHMLL